MQRMDDFINIAGQKMDYCNQHSNIRFMALGLECCGINLLNSIRQNLRHHYDGQAIGTSNCFFH